MKKIPLLIRDIFVFIFTMYNRRGAVDMLWFCKDANTKFTVKIMEARNVVGNLSRLFGIGVKAGKRPSVFSLALCGASCLFLSHTHTHTHTHNLSLSLRLNLFPPSPLYLCARLKFHHGLFYFFQNNFLSFFLTLHLLRCPYFSPAVYLGEEMICKPETTRYIPATENPVWYVGICL